MMQEILIHSAQQAQIAIQQLQSSTTLSFMQRVVYLLAETFRKGKKVIIAGNGGSLCDAAHFAEELTGQFRNPRPPLPAIVLNEAAHITCVSNDMGYKWVFSRAIQALGQEEDLFIGLTTSGNSPNMVHAFEMCKTKGLKTVAFLGKGGGKLAGFADLEWIVDGNYFSDRIQELHMSAIHMIIEALEVQLFPEEILLKKEMICSTL